MATVQAPRRRGAPATGAAPRSGSAAPLRAVPTPAPRRRPDLTLVADRPRRHVAPAVLATVVVVALFAVLFGLAAFHVVLIQGQQRLDELDEQVTDEQDRYERLRLEVAALESPARVVETAVRDLGMVTPDGTTYLNPSAAVSAEASTGDSPPPQTESEVASAWPDVKPYLSAER
jgi:cell division protein FtsL